MRYWFAVGCVLWAVQAQAACFSKALPAEGFGAGGTIGIPAHYYICDTLAQGQALTGLNTGDTLYAGDTKQTYTQVGGLWGASAACCAGGIGLGALPLTDVLETVTPSVGPGIILQPATTSDTNSPFMIKQVGSNRITNLFNSGGGYYTVTWVVISGDFNASINASGDLSVANYGQSNIAGGSMLETISDVGGPNYLSKTSTVAGSYHMQMWDRNKNFVYKMTEPGSMYWGTSASAGNEDTGLERVAASVLGINNGTSGTITNTRLQLARISLGTLSDPGTDATLLIANNGTIQWKTSGGAAATILQLDNGNNFTMSGAPGGSFVMVPATNGFFSVRNHAQTVSLLQVQESNQTVTIQQFVSVVQTLGTVGTAVTVNPGVGDVLTLTSTAATNMAVGISNAGNAGQHIWLIITSDATGGDIITFSSPFKPNGTMTLTASKKHTIHFVSDGTNWCEVARTLGL